jgi:hypothetical protein
MADSTVLGLGLGLIAVNAWTGNQKSDIASLLNGKPTSTAKRTAINVGGETALVLVMSFVAQSGPGASKAMLAAIVALWVLWGIQHYSGTAAPEGAAQAPRNPTVTNPK